MGYVNGLKKNLQKKKKKKLMLSQVTQELATR